MNYTNISQNLNITTIGDVLQQANTNTGGSFWTGIYWMIITIVMLSAFAFGFEVALIFAFFVGLILGILLLYADLITLLTFGVTEGVLIFIVIYLVYSSSKNQ